MAETIKLHILHCGSTIVDVSNIFPPEKPSKNPVAWMGILRPKKYQRSIPVTSYLIEHPKGLVVIDTGFHKRVRKHPIRELTIIHNKINKPVQKEGEAIDEMLAARGIRPEDIDYVVLSHLHSDHASGVRSLKKAKNIYAEKTDYEIATGFSVAFLNRWYKGVPFKTFEYEETGIGPVGKSWDLFGDGTIQFVNLPGHTPGLAGCLIRNNGKEIFLTADCGYGHESWEQDIIPSVCDDHESFEKSMAWIREEAAKPDCIACLANHQIDVPAMDFEL